MAVTTARTDRLDRSRLWQGDVLELPVTEAAVAFREHCWRLVVEAFAPHEPHAAQAALCVDDFVAVLALLKPAFVHDPTSKQLLAALLEAAGCERDATYFDLPKLRVVTSGGYLTAGLGYAYHSHRDVWYAAPPCQVNWWMPLTPVQPTSTLAFHPDYWARPVANDSADFDAYRWNSTGRADAARHVRSDTRNHPQAPVTLDLARDVLVLPDPGACITFSAAHLHSTVPNTSGRTRFSVDFRTVHHDDLLAGAGAELVDTHSTGTTLRDFLRADDLSPVPDHLVSRYDHGSTHDGALIYQAADDDASQAAARTTTPHAGEALVSPVA